MRGYLNRLREEIAGAEALARSLKTKLERDVDSIYLGGGTPSILDADQLKDVFATIRSEFRVLADAEITIECAPGTLKPETLDAMQACGANRISLGTQSFVDREIRSVGRLHTAAQACGDVALLRAQGIRNINLDLIAGLPHQQRDSWRASLRMVAELAVPHASVYILEVDEDSHLGRELLAGGQSYHAHHVPDSDLAADMYLEAIDTLANVGLPQYEISNFSGPGCQSEHNLKYWKREPYVGFGLDAHSMLPARDAALDFEAVRFGNTDELDTYIRGVSPSVEKIDRQLATEETLFLGLRLNQGLDLAALPSERLRGFESDVAGLCDAGLLERSGDFLRLTKRGRLLSNEVFQRFISSPSYA